MLDIQPIMTVEELYIIKEKEDKKIRRKEKMKAFVKGLFKLIFMEFVICLFSIIPSARILE